MKKISILGSTGSIGTQTLDVIRNAPDKYQVTGLSAGHNVDLLAAQIEEFSPAIVSLQTKELADELKARITYASKTRVVYGDEGMIEVAANTDADTVVTAIVGSCGLAATLAAIEQGKTIGLANKETLVAAGEIVKKAARLHQVQILPVDSEHSAIWQCLNGEPRSAVRGITLTASGGSFRHLSREELADVTLEQALSHPNWSMGSKITIDSATMVNKGLEVIEAHWLFDLDYDQISVLQHAESVIHSFVEFEDSSIIAQLGVPDMRVPIQYALSYPDRHKAPVERLDLAAIGKLHFQKMDFERYPCLRLAYHCGEVGRTAPAVFNAANEVAVARFLRGEISFLDIERILDKVVSQHAAVELEGLSHLEEIDGWARRLAGQV